MCKWRCLGQECLVGLREAMSHRALEECIRGGPCLKELRAVHPGRRAGTRLPCSATGLTCPACWERKCYHDESTGFGKIFHPVVLKALFKCGGGGLVAKLCRTPVSPWTHGARQAPLSMGFSRQEYWSGLPFPSPGDLPDPGLEPGLLRCRQMIYQLSYEGGPCLSVLNMKHLVWTSYSYY